LFFFFLWWWMSKHTAPEIISTSIQRKMAVYCSGRQTVRQAQQET
jgi:hypothetical protein